VLIVRAPLRISFGGGGTDLPAYYERYGGLVVSTAIDKYVYVYLSENGAAGAQVMSADYQIFYQHHCGTPLTWTGELALPRAVLHEFGIDRGVSVFLASEVPPGTGLGSSSAVAVALIQGLACYLGRPLAPMEAADLACRIELERLQAPIGKQDQYATAHGGLNAISFDREGVVVEPLRVAPDVVARLESRLLLFFTGTARNSAAILREQQRASAQGVTQTIEGLHRIKAMGLACRRCLEDRDLDGLGRLLDEGWREKRRLADGITNQQIDDVYDLAIARGALGGKITGAGGGGFLLLYCNEAKRNAVIQAMEQRGLRRMSFRFEPTGVSVSEIKWSASPADWARSVGSTTGSRSR
jgi:D-glycero-alpha-D-manno-heptose-7-phosphate kinase